MQKGGGKLKRQILTKQDIQKELLAKLNKVRGFSILLTVLTVICIILYPVHLINYLNGTPFDYAGRRRFPDLTPTAAMFVIPLLILILAVAVFYVYYIDLYKIKRGMFEITQEKLCQKDKEYARYSRQSTEEYALYFSCGKATVNYEVYLHSDIGDRFYVVTLKSKFRSKQNPRLVYHTKYYEIYNV